MVFDTGACRLCLHGGGKGRIGEEAPKVVFQVEDVAQTREELMQRGVTLGEIRSPAPGVTVCDGRDPAGNPFSLEARGVSASARMTAIGSVKAPEYPVSITAITSSICPLGPMT